MSGNLSFRNANECQFWSWLDHLTVKPLQEAGMYWMYFLGKNGYVFRKYSKNGNPVRKIPTRILFLPLNNLGPLPCVCIPWGPQDWASCLRVSRYIFFHFSEPKAEWREVLPSDISETLEGAQWPGHQNALLEPTQLHRHLSVLKWWPFICL